MGDVVAALVPAEILTDDVARAREDEFSLATHRSQCSVCQHPDLSDIEALYCTWLDPSKIAGAYRLNVDALQTHAARFGWRHERVANIEIALAGLLERMLARLAPTEQVTLDQVVGVAERITRGQMHLAGAPKRVERALAGGRQPAPVLQAGRAKTWERTIRESVTVREPAELPAGAAAPGSSEPT